jgi:hypothetical protein
LLLTGWGQPGPTDLDGDGITNGADLSALLAAWGACPTPPPATFFVGIVVLADGTPLGGAVVVTDLGGSAMTGETGEYELSLVLDTPVESVTLTAIATIGGTTYQGSTVVGTVVLGGLNEADPIVASPQPLCSGEFAWLPGVGTPGVDNQVYAFTVFDDGTGPALHVGGYFTTAGGAPANRIAKWNGSAWSPLGSGLSGGHEPCVYALTVFDDGTGPALYAGGSFALAGDVAASRIARWDGTSWSPLGSGVSGTPPFGFTSVYALTVFDDGTGPALYAGGDFTNAGGVDASRIARWDGTSWSALGSGMSGGGVQALAVFDDGTGAALYAAGGLTFAGGVSASRIARWDGTAWSPLGEGTSGPVSTLGVFDDGSAPALYAGGFFTTAAQVEANGIARWDGSTWSPLGSGMDAGVRALTVFDDGAGPALYAGGWFATAGGVAANRIARWDGTAWSPLGSGTSSVVFALSVFDDGTGPALYAGGGFAFAGGVAVNNIARWGCDD